MIAILLVGAKTKVGRISKNAGDLPRVEVSSQRDQALKLFPSQYAGLALAMDGGADMREFILTTVQRSLASEQRERAFDISRAVIVEANHHRMDPLFLLALIATESQFNIHARGTHGEIGLMQIMPKTAKWLAPHAGLSRQFNLEDPATNIRVGATYLAQLQGKFNGKGLRFIAAYNMGSKNVRQLVAKHKEPKIYPTRVINNYVQIYSGLDGFDTPATATRGLASVR